ncbi:MAG: electron transfer flavoprotein subunit alpha/FixB family protein [Candidatus Limnocylindrales bacterium]
MALTSVLVLVEHEAGRPDRLSLEALAMARRVGDGGTAINTALFGAGGAEAAAGLAGQGVVTAHVVQHEHLAAYAPAAWAAAIEQLIASTRPDLVIAPGSERGTEVLAHVAARLDLPMAANCTDVRGGEPFEVTRQRWGGSLLEDARLEGAVRLLTVAPHALAPEEVAGAAAPAVKRFTPRLDDADLRVRVVGRLEPEAGSIALADARVVVGGGRGVGGAPGFEALQELAALLGGTIGVSRAVTSAGWRPHAEQVGQTGARIAPELYIACGISGAIQHIVGCKAARRILAINTDPDAPIMARADYALIGDLKTIVPALSAEIRRVRSV